MDPSAERIKLLLSTLDEARIAWNAGSGGEGSTLMPSMYVRGSYQELEEALRKIREVPATRSAWKHVSMRYRWGDLVWIEVSLERRDKNPHYKLPPNCELRAAGEHTATKAKVRVYRWSLDTKPELACLGVELLKRIMYGGEDWRITLPPGLAIQPHSVVSCAA